MKITPGKLYNRLKVNFVMKSSSVDVSSSSTTSGKKILNTQENDNC